MYRIALPIETKVRELNGKLWLAAHLARRGYKVAIGELTCLKKNIDVIKPHIYVGDSAVYKKSREDLYRRLKQANVAVAVHDTEGGIIYSHEYYKGRLSNEILQYVDCFLAWGNETAEIFRNVVKNEEVLLETVGSPGFDLLCEKYRSFYKHESAQIVRQFGRFVLINTHFGFYNHYDREKYVEPLRPKWPGMYEFKKKLFFSFVNAIKKLSKKYQEINFIIRPHPSENFETYKTIFHDYNNVIIEYTLSVHPWALAAQMIIHNGCTTGVESALLGRPVVAYRSVRDKVWDVHVPNFVSIEANTLHELDYLVQYYCYDEHNEGGQRLNEEQITLIEKCLYIQDGMAAERICNAFDSLLADSQKAIGKIYRISVTRRAKSAFMQMVRSFSSIRNIKSAKGNKKITPSYTQQKFSGLDRDELRELLERFINIKPKFNQLNIKSLDNINNIFWIDRI